MIWKDQADIVMVTLPDHILEKTALNLGLNSADVQGTPRLEENRIHALVRSLLEEEAIGFPAGRLYLDYVSYALATALFSQHRSQTASTAYRGGLSPLQLRRTLDYIQETSTGT